jgi:RNA recognition motif-containing protein
MPDEYLPPNSVLFVQNLPEGTTAEDLREVFEQYAGLQEIRTVPAKRDIAFVEFVDEATSAVAKDALHNFKIDGETKMKVSSSCFSLADSRSRLRASSQVDVDVSCYYPVAPRPPACPRLRPAHGINA